jgi:hypothetical protein
LVETLDLKSSQTLQDLVLPLQYDAATYMNLINQLERHFGGKDSDLAMSAKALVHPAKIDMKSKASVTELATKLQAHKSLLELYGRVETEFAESSQLYRDLVNARLDDECHRDFQKYRLDNKLDRSPQLILLWLDRMQTMLEDMENCTSKATHSVAKEKFRPYQSTALLTEQSAPYQSTAWPTGQGASDVEDDNEDEVIANVLYTGNNRVQWHVAFLRAIGREIRVGKIIFSRIAQYLYG